MVVLFKLRRKEKMSAIAYMAASCDGDAAYVDGDICAAAISGRGLFTHASGVALTVSLILH